MMPKDIRGSAAARQIDSFYRSLFRPGEGHLWTAADLDPASDGRRVHFTGQCFEGALSNGPSSAIYELNLREGHVHRIAKGRLFRNSLDTRTAHVEPGESGEQLVIATSGGERITVIPVTGRIESLMWSPSGRELLVLAADVGADVAGVEGGFAMRGAAPAESWLPEIITTTSQDLWRRLYRWSKGAEELIPVTQPPVNVWEAAWLGEHTAVVVASDHHGEGSWYEASVRLLDTATGAERSRHTPTDQIGVPVGAANGQRWAVIEAFCSDRGLVCGTVILGEEGVARPLDLGGVEATDIRWRSSSRLLFSGLRGAETVVGEIDVVTGERLELWASEVLTIGGWYPNAVPIGNQSALAVIEGYAQAPSIARFDGQEEHILARFAPSDTNQIRGTMRHICWPGRDGLQIQGWLVLPDCVATNLPVLIDIHGGPVSAHRNRYAASLRAGAVLVAQGYALLLPNPRGSSGRGQDFARMVKGDMGGEDMHDCLCGLNLLVEQGIVDPARVAVTGTSYGGFMSAWLVTQTNRIAAAVPISPVANWYSQHFASQIPWFDQNMLNGSLHQSGSQYFDRSPAFFASGAKAPTLVLAGGRDKNTPTGQAIELFGALAEARVDAALAIYPEDGHSLRGYPAYIDSAARILDWLDRHIGQGFDENGRSIRL